ncbi:methyltransferase domain-containing protein [Cylindrospermopsis raciborskii DSH]|uniref:class I SAM-dependent methyltransferase n=1 Tax=Cylindrospermopsis raciborskii TaxID=77022 RepID=UPI002EDB9768
MNYKELVSKYGAFTASNFYLKNLDIKYTIGNKPTGDDVKIYRVTQLAKDFLGGSLEGKKILDIACLEGAYAIELSKQGASVTAVEIREANIEKAKFAAECLGVLDKIEFIHGDILDVELGTFDIVLCLGIFYHFNETDTFRFAEKVSQWVKPNGVAIIDTFFSIFPHSVYKYNGVKYYGNPWIEHYPWETLLKRQNKLWQSLHNTYSLYLTKKSIARLFGNLGFTSFFEGMIPCEPKKHFQRATFVGIKGEPMVAQTNNWINIANKEIKESNLIAKIREFFS